MVLPRQVLIEKMQQSSSTGQNGPVVTQTAPTSVDCPSAVETESFEDVRSICSLLLADMSLVHKVLSVVLPPPREGLAAAASAAFGPLLWWWGGGSPTSLRFGILCKLLLRRRLGIPPSPIHVLLMLDGRARVCAWRSHRRLPSLNQRGGRVRNMNRPDRCGPMGAIPTVPWRRAKYARV